MSRSRRKPFWSMADSVKKWKRQYHGEMRAKLRMQMIRNPECVPVIVDENAYSDVYDSPRDGKAQYVGKDETWTETSKLTRK